MRSSVPLEEELPDNAPASVTRRALAWSALGVVLAGAAVTRLAGMAPAGSESVPFAVNLASLTADQAVAALRGAPFGADAIPGMIAAIRERRLQLVQAPFFGVGGAVGMPITITCGAVVRTIVLTGTPTPVLLPIERLGRIVVEAAPMSTDGRIGLVTAVAALDLPPIGPGRSLILDVIVQ